MAQDDAVIGCTGVLLLGTRGTAGPGEDLFALSHRTPSDAGLWVPTPI